MKHKKIKLIISTIFLLLAFFSKVYAHPGSGIVVDKNGNVYFVYSGKGIVKISSDGWISNIHTASDGHWLCLDEHESFYKSNPTYFERIRAEATRPAFIFAGGGSPIVVSKDGNLFYCGGLHGDINPGGKTIVKETPAKQLAIFSTTLEDTLDKLDDGIIGITLAPDGSLYLACWNSIIKLGMDGKIKVLTHPVLINECDEDPADHREINRGKPLLRGIAIDSAGDIYSCHCIIKITPDGKLITMLKSERPWSPTGVYYQNGNIYVLEYTHANGPATEGWLPRVRKLDQNGKISLLADMGKKGN